MLTRGRKAHARASPDAVLYPLPRCFVRAVLLLLPADTRLRCSEVSRAWRALLADTTLLSSLNLSVSSGCARFSEALLRAAVAKAGGQLRELDVTGRRDVLATSRDDDRSTPGLCFALHPSLSTLRAVCRTTFFDRDALLDILEAAPELQYLEANATAADVDEARSFLRNEEEFGPLRIHGLRISRKPAAEVSLDSLASVEAFCADMVTHSSLKNSPSSTHRSTPRL